MATLASASANERAALGITPSELSRHLRVPHNRITEIIRGQRAITGDTALRLAHWFGTAPSFWMNLQSLYDLRCVERSHGQGILALPRRSVTAGHMSP